MTMTNLNIMAHCGGKFVAREELMTVQLPQRTASYCPVPHESLLQTVEANLAKIDYEVVQEKHVLAKDGARYFGVIELRPDGHQTSDEYSLVVGLRNSYDKSLPAGLAVGSGVFVCDNLAFSGEVTFGRKHTTHAMRHLPVLVQNNIFKVRMMEDIQRQRLEQYKMTRMSPMQADSMIMELMRRGVIPAQKIPKVYEEWVNPSHEEFTEDGWSVWRMFNAVTEVLKKNESENQFLVLPKRTQKLHVLSDEVCAA